MKNPGFISVICLCSFFVFVNISSADDISSLKEQIKAMQEQLASQMKIIDKQNRQIETMQGRISHLEGKAAGSLSPPGTGSQDKDQLHVKWNNGLSISDERKNFNIKIGGRIQVDGAWMKEGGDVKSSVGDLKDTVEIRRARLYTAGTIYKDFIYKFQMDFAGGDADFKDVYFGMKNIPYIGRVRVGHMQEPFCVEQLTSNKYITFLERSLADVFSPERNTGIMANNTLFDKRMTWAAGGFFDADSFADGTSNEVNFTARVTGLPIYENQGDQLLHLGLGYTYRNPEESVRYRQRPENHLAPYFVDTGNIAAKNVNQLGYEVAGVYGPFSLQGELVHNYVNKTTGSEYAQFYGIYGQASYFITGETRPYDTKTGVFSRVIPRNDFSIEEGTYGAWELAARYSHLDLNDNDVSGGIMSDVTIGINWYLNPNMRIMGNYIHSHLNGKGDADMFTTRFQVDF